MSQATQAELEAILHGAAIAPIERGFLHIRGSDATRWLNGMVTNSIQSLQPGEGNYNFLLNAQGRIQADCTIYRELRQGEASFLLETDQEQVASVQELLDRFIIMDDVELEADDASLAETVLLMGSEAGDLLRSWALPVPEPLRIVTSTEEQGTITTPAPSPVPMFHLHGNPRVIEGLRASAAHAGAVKVSADSVAAFRIYSGQPRYGKDIRNSETARDLPQETNQTHALHFSKGCYLGQEIVERIRSRGQVHRQFTRFRLHGESPATLPAPLEVEGKPAGELTSAALVPLPGGSELYALGYARREFLELRKTFSYAGGTATPASASEI